jgi:outer membrane protein OmpA-like peptidoglycan-associated protein
MHKEAMAAVAALLLVGLAVPAAAEEPSHAGAYFGFGAGINFLLDQDADAFGSTVVIENETDAAALLQAGYRFDNGLRLELEGSYRDNDVSDSNAPLFGETGSFHSAALMANGYFDIGLGQWTPYVGIGAGVARVWGDFSHSGGGVWDDRDTVFAYQAMLGVGYHAIPELELFLDYRYFATSDAHFDVAGGDVQIDNKNHTIMAGLRWTFWKPSRAPAPAPQPVAAPQPTPAPPPAAPPIDRFLVFFEFDHSELTGDGVAVVRKAAEALLSGRYVRLEVTGYADRAGSEDYNLDLSQRRAETVATALVMNGVPAAAIRVGFRGEADPLVPTADGVREAQNRRAEIVVQ